MVSQCTAGRLVEVSAAAPSPCFQGALNQESLPHTTTANPNQRPVQTGNSPRHFKLNHLHFAKEESEAEEEVTRAMAQL